MHEENSIGFGLFANHDGFEVGDIVARYPGNPEWHEPNREGNLRCFTEFTFNLGSFQILSTRENTIVNRILAWNVTDIPEKGQKHWKRGHYANTSHPRSLQLNYREPNAVWGIKIHKFEMKENERPNIKLFLIATKHIPRYNQILIDYHWVLAWKGFWCLDDSCGNCVEGLKWFTKYNL